MAQRVGMYVALDINENPVDMAPDIAALIEEGWKYVDTFNLTYGQLANPPTGPSSTPVTVFFFEDVTAKEAAVTPTLEGLFGAS